MSGDTKAPQSKEFDILQFPEGAGQFAAFLTMAMVNANKSEMVFVMDGAAQDGVTCSLRFHVQLDIQAAN